MSEQPNPESARQDALRAARKQATNSLLLAMAALAVVVIACYGWFVHNTSVTGSLGSISAGIETFELASAGTRGAYYDQTPEIWRVEGTEETYPTENGILTVFQTGVNSPVLWRVSDSSHFGNSSAAEGIAPGREGTLEFYVIPKRSGTATFTFQLELIPLNSSYQEIQDETLAKLLSGHLLFSYESGSNRTWMPYDSLTFSRTFQDAKADTPCLVTLHWKWPYLLSDVSSDAVIKGWMTAAPDRFFYAKGGSLPKVNLITNFKKLNECYNNADQYIGENLSALILRLTARTG